ncbi:hypothetical protein [uncultured Aquimarina sp.]|uniref:hypothetical protein n=1 Tax=uncultured Aquimarina sp. TaxID=575652 RepID=UPI0026291D0A|nr:hypothetical protein [uncultured Aquimarina sp.]
MAKINIIRSWRDQKVMLKRKFSILSDKDFDFNEDQKEVMFDGLAIKLNKSREELEVLFAELQRY